jgi:uncharacterized protein (TIGR02284 family)
MSVDEKITRDLVQTLEDGKDGFAKGAEKLESEDPGAAVTFRQYSQQRRQFAEELRGLAAEYGDQVDDDGSVAAAVHRGWMTLKDAVTGASPSGVLDAAEQGEDHAVREYENALGEPGMSARLREVVQRQAVEVKVAHDTVRAMRDAAA